METKETIKKKLDAVINEIVDIKREINYLKEPEEEKPEEKPEEKKSEDIEQLSSYIEERDTTTKRPMFPKSVNFGNGWKPKNKNDDIEKKDTTTKRPMFPKSVNSGNNWKFGTPKPKDKSKKLKFNF